MKQITQTTMEIQRGGVDVEVNIDGYVVYEIDKLSGADADGNRAIKEVIVNDVLDVDAWYDGDGATVSLSNEEQLRAEELLTEKFLEG